MYASNQKARWRVAQVSRRPANMTENDWLTSSAPKYLLGYLDVKDHDGSWNGWGNRVRALIGRAAE